MKLLSKYEDFIVELKLTEALKTFPLFLSKRLREFLSQIDHEIASELLSQHSDLDTRVKHTFIDLHNDKSDCITFIQPNKAIDILKWDIKDEEEEEDILLGNIDSLMDISDDDNVYKRYRGELKWGRFLNINYPGEYSLSIGGGQNKKDIESFVNMYKSLYTQETTFKRLDIVNGDQISEWYHCDNYNDNDAGSLGDSCMKEVDEEYFEIYVNNPNKVSLIIMYADDNKDTICARALLWTLEIPSGRKFMDRIYTNDYSHEQSFIDFAKHNNWFYKTSQSMGAEIEIIDPETDISREIVLMSILHSGIYDKYPYCDTMTFYAPDTGKISNQAKFDPRFELTDTDGEAYNIDDDEENDIDQVYSNYLGYNIDKDEAQYCKFGDDWVREDDAIRVWNSDGENYAVPGNTDIVQSKWGTSDKWFPKEKCRWSDYLNTWVFKSSIRRVWGDLERNKLLIDHKKRLDDEFFKIDGEFWNSDLVEDGKLIGEVIPKVDRPVGELPRGWHRRKEFVDDDGNIFRRGIFSGNER